MKFPVYRKYLNEMSYFKIDGPGKFEEIRRIGSRLLITVHEAKILPERNMIHDLLNEYISFAVEISAEEYDELAQKARESEGK
jgi:hypothetical protein